MPGAFADQTGAIFSVRHSGYRHSAADAYFLSAERGEFVLKTSADAGQIRDIQAEAEILTRLAGFSSMLAVAHGSVVQEGRGFSLASRLPGRNLSAAIAAAAPPQKHALLREFAAALREVHSWTPDLPRPGSWLDEALDRARRWLAREPPARPTLLGAWEGVPPQEVISRLDRWRRTVSDDIVFGHGDYCLPNVLVRRRKATGIVDWGAGGYADRRLDLGTVLWTIRYNLHDLTYGDTFLEAYGYPDSAESLEPFETLYELSSRS